MEALLDSCLQQRRPTILVVGDIMCDTYLWGKVSRISPEAPVPIFESAERRHVLGGAANVAANLRALGCDVQLLGVIGADAAGRCVREQLYEQGIADTWLVQDVTRPTTEKTRLIASQQQLLRLDYESQTPLSPSLVVAGVAVRGASHARHRRCGVLRLPERGLYPCASRTICSRWPVLLVIRSLLIPKCRTFHATVEQRY